MSVKDDVLSQLEKNRGQHISGEELAESLNVSRNSVWKAIKQLEKLGYSIAAVTNKGYCLLESNEIISKQSIENYLIEKNVSIETYKTVSSTNSLMKEKAEDSAPEWTVIVADEQTSGRGRMGRSFYSPPNTGIYMSVLLRPQLPANQSIYITTCAAVAVAKAIDNNAGVEAKIKWVNDIFLGNKKVCGILTEGTTDIENGELKYVVLGIGINIFPPDEKFPEEIKDVATTVFAEAMHDKDYRSKIIADVINNLMEMYPELSKKEFFNEYKNRSFLLGKRINIIRKDGVEEAKALDLDESFGLIVEKMNGSLEHLYSGEVSVCRVV